MRAGRSRCRLAIQCLGQVSRLKLDDRLPGFSRAKAIFRSGNRCNGRRVVLEGGDRCQWHGLLLTTEGACSKTQERNPPIAPRTNEFADYLGAKKMLWLGRGIVGDDGHVDDPRCRPTHGRYGRVKRERRNYVILESERLQE